MEAELYSLENLTLREVKALRTALYPSYRYRCLFYRYITN